VIYQRSGGTGEPIVEIRRELGPGALGVREKYPTGHIHREFGGWNLRPFKLQACSAQEPPEKKKSEKPEVAERDASGQIGEEYHGQLAGLKDRAWGEPKGVGS